MSGLKVRLTRIAVILPLVMVALTLVASLAVGVVGYYNGQAGLTMAVQKELESQVSARVRLLNLKLQNTLAQLDSLVQSEGAGMMSQITIPRIAGQVSPEKHYFSAPRTVGERESLDGSALKSIYSYRHSQYHATFLANLRNTGLGEIYIVNKSGDVVYSVTKSVEFFGNVSDEDLLTTPLNALFVALRSGNSSKGTQLISAFISYQGEPALFVAKRIFTTDSTGTPQFTGVMAFRLNVSFFDTVLSERLGDTGQLFLSDENGLVLSSLPRSKLATALIANRPYRVLKAAQTGASFDIEPSDKGDMTVAAAPIRFLGATWFVVAEQTAYESFAAVDRMATGMIIGTLIVLGVACAVAGLFARSISRPVSRMTQVMRAFAEGQYDVKILGTKRTNELGDMARSVEVFRDAMMQRERLLAEQNASAGASEHRRQTLERLIESFRHETAADLVTVAAINIQLGATASALDSIAYDALGKAASATTAAEGASSNVNTVAQAATELFRSIEEISQQVGRTNEIVSRAADTADSASSKIAVLATAAQEIGNVVSLIQQISEQTSLLALNATIEAARAGEAGRGFAVVAQEVKALSGQTSNATAQISQRIAAVQCSTQEAVDAINEINGIMGVVSSFTASIAAAVMEQGAATSEISRNVAHAATGASTVLRNIQAVSAASASATRAATEVAGASVAVGEKGFELKARIEAFLGNVAAA
jgi:methyl-accepting chemotaxis protein